MNSFALSGLLGCITSLALGIFSWTKGKKFLNKLWAIFNLSVAIWGFGAYKFSTTLDKSAVFFWLRFGHIGVILIPILFIHFVFEFLGIKKKGILYFAYAVGGIFFILNITDWLGITKVFIVSLRYVFNSFYVDSPPGPIYPFFVLFFFIIVIYAHYCCLEYFRTSTGIKRMQIKYFLSGMAISFGGGGTAFLMVFNINIYPYLHFTVFLYPIILTYAIFKYRLMDINIAIRKVIANSILATIFCILIVSTYPLQIPMTIKIFLIVIFGISISVYLPQLKFNLESFINRLLFGTKYDYQQTLAEVSDTVPTIIDLDRMLKYIIDKICKSMGIKNSAVLLKKDRGNIYTIHYQHGFDEEKLFSIKLESNNPLITRVKNIEDVLVRHEMAHILKQENYNELCVDLDKFDAEVVVPIRKGGNLIGLITLSNKAGGDTFGPEDYRLLHIIAIQAAVAIENIRLYNKLIHTDRQSFLETLSSGVSHELRNRLVAIRTFIDLFPDRVKTEHVEKGYLEFRDLAVREMERLTKIIDGLLSYSRAVSKGGEELSINALLDESVLIIDPKVKEKEIKLNKNLDEKVSTIKGDKGRLLQVFINIMQNGIDAMDNGGQLTVTSINKDNEVEVDISDNGKGIEKEHLDAIFEPFFTTKHTGTGLGLSIVQRIVRDHNGQIRVESELGKGTTFIITFQKGIDYQPADIKAKKELSYWEVKKEFEEPGNKKI